MVPTTTSAPASSPLTVHVIHDNPEWIPPFATALETRGIEVVEWLLPDTTIDLSQEPPQGLYWSRLSASSHTRTDPHVKEYGRALLAWLEAGGRTVLNGAHVYELEVSKVLQHRRLETRGFSVPRTVAALGAAGLADAVRTLDPPFITKHNQGGKGLGVRRFDDHDAFRAYVEGAEFEDAADGITLLQELLIATEPAITRAEFVGGEFVCAVRVDTSQGGFELCPAEACAVPSAEPMFRLRPEVTAEDPLIRRFTSLLADLGVEIAGVEYMATVDGRTVAYDINTNTNTNYNPEVEAALEVSAARRIARYLGALLREERSRDAAHGRSAS